MSRLTIAANRGDIGGGEVMLLHLAQALRDIGTDVVVVGPEHPGDLLQEADGQGLQVEAIPASDRRSYLLNLRAWDRKHRDGVLWCNGLVPAVATAGHPQRVVHLHQLPTRRQRPLARAARHAALATVVPSWFMAEHLPGSIVLPNFVPPPDLRRRRSDDFRIGFLGRASTLKGTDVLAQAVARLEKDHPTARRIIVGGASRFVAADDAAGIQQALDALHTPVDMLGWVAPQEFLGQVDVLAVPSRVPESFGLVAAEAMAAGVPLIVSDAGALPEVVGPDHPWVVPAGDPQALARVLRSVETADADTVERAVLAAQARWEDRFSPAAGAANLRELLSSIGMSTGTLESGASA